MDNDEHIDFSHAVRFQIPQFIYSAAPLLAPGGGAEVLPGGLHSQASWVGNNLFSGQKYIPEDQHVYAFNSQARTAHDHANGPFSYPNDEPTQQSQLASSAPFDFDEYTNDTTSALSLSHTHQAPTPPSHLNPDLSAFFSTSGVLANPPSLLVQQHPQNQQQQPHILSAPSPCGLPVYSASGFDLLSVLARVATRPNPHVVLGPVDLTCSFVVVDVRRYDHPIVYCSPQFCALTGYEEHEVLGRNCRFLQAPGGLVQKGEERRFTDGVAVAQLRKSLIANKECQASIVNYKKDRQAFINMVTIIPVFEGDGNGQRDAIYHVGFQVDLTRQPGAILEKVRDGSYAMDFALRGPTSTFQLTYPTIDGLRQVQKSEHRKTTAAIPPPVMSKDLKKLLADPAFVRSFPITTCTTVPPPLSSSSSALSLEDTQLGSNSLLSLILLEASPDFIHVVSLKGTFLYVSPSVRRVLGYEPSELVGGSISDLTHPEDVVPLMRELKESSATAVNVNSTSAGGGMIADTTSGSGAAAQATPRSVDLLFRARTKPGVYVWVECRGRLHVEPGKGRKAIILSGRAKEMTKLTWGDMVRWGRGLTKKLSAPLNGEVTKEDEVEYSQEFWGMMHGESFTVHGMTFLSAAVDVKHILGYTPTEMVGMNLGGTLADGDVERVEQELAARGICLSTIGSRYQQQYRHQHSGTVKAVNIRCQMKRKDDGLIQVDLIIYRSPRDPLVDALPTTTTKNTISPSPLVYRIKLVDPSAYLQSSSSSSAASLSSNNDLNLAHPLEENMFQDLETSRNSSWQYELQQLRFANQRLEEEIKTLEGTIAAQEKAKAGDKPQPQAKQNTSRKVGGTQQQRRDSHSRTRGKEYYQQPPVEHQEHHVRDYATMRPLQIQPHISHIPQRPATPGPYDLSSSQPHPLAMTYANIQAPIPSLSSVPLEWSSPPVPMYIPNGGQSRQGERTNHGLRTTGTGAIKRSWNSLAP